MEIRKTVRVIARSAALGAAFSLLLFSACAGSPTCQDYGNCSESAGGSGGALGGAGANGGNLGEAGNAAASGVADTDGGSSGASDAAGAGGASGAAGEPPCNGDCGGETPVCDAVTDTCVECSKPTDCKAPRRACDAAKGECVECVTAADCADRSKPFCDRSAGKCVACLEQADCTDPAASACHAGACSACSKDEECANTANKGVCDAGTCVQCTGKKFAACGQDSGTPLVCDSLSRTCTTNKLASAGLCETCVSDAHCSPGQQCVLDKFGSPAKSVGYFCHWKKGDLANGAPADCASTGRPYSSTQVNVLSIDGNSSDICTLLVSTCVARNQFKSKDCTVTNAPSDAACGVAPAVDSKCAAVPSSSSYRCTMTCASSDDCPAPFTCKTGAATPVCSFD